jgi:hypothetical protein
MQVCVSPLPDNDLNICRGSSRWHNPESFCSQGPADLIRAELHLESSLFGKHYDGGLALGGSLGRGQKANGNG